MDVEALYENITNRKIKIGDYNSYNGNNGRVNRCVSLFKNGKLPVGGVLVDVGGGIGDLGYAVKDMFTSTWIIDISQKNLEAAKSKGNHVICSNIDKDGIQLCDKHANVVTALDIIEHLVDPEFFAKECHRTLKDNGVVFINTPNIQFWKHIDYLIQTGKFPHTSGDKEVYHGGHLAFYTYFDLCEIFSFGFKDFEMIEDEENFCHPPQWIMDMQTINNQFDYVELTKRLGSSNLLFKCCRK